jgi:hypothetical protein
MFGRGSGLGSDKKVVKAEFETPVNESTKSNARKHVEKPRQRNSLLVLLAFHLAAHHPNAVEQTKHRIHEGLRPRENQRAFRRQYPISLSEQRLRRRQVFEYGEHDNMVETRITERQTAGDVGAKHGATRVGGRLDLIVQAYSPSDSRTGIGKEGGVETAANVADGGLGSQIRKGRAESPASHEAIQCGVGHLVLQVVVADVGAAADAKHAEKE